ncbi:MAG: DMT family transporter [Actinomycetota bacterium]|nr:DMT family transporter [Actinomycetota bacterium]
MLQTAHGTRVEPFGAIEWGLLAGIAAIWGSSFLFIAIGLEAFAPGVVAGARLTLGVVALALVPRARSSVHRDDWPRVAVLGLVWMAAPLLLFPIAQQWVDSSVAGMINGAVPLWSALIATLLLRSLPRPTQVAGLALGFLGVVAIMWPNASGSDASPLGVALLVVAVALYGLATNLAVPLQQRYGSAPVLLRAQLVALMVIAPVGAASVPTSTWKWSSALAMVPLGVLGTGLAFVGMTTLVGRVGAARGSVAIYFIPVVAIVLGVTVRGETVHPLALVGTALVLLGAWLTSRRERRRTDAGSTVVVGAPVPPDVNP